MVIKCSECQKGFEPPFDPNEFLVWIDAIEDGDDWKCLDCAGVGFLKDLSKSRYISIVAPMPTLVKPVSDTN